MEWLLESRGSSRYNAEDYILDQGNIAIRARDSYRSYYKEGEMITGKR